MTLLFADIVGFTSMGEAHDPELVSSLVSEAFVRLARPVSRYDGTVEKFAGDAMLAVFGVPAAHEDDPERAVRAAFEMQAAMAALRSSADDAWPKVALRIGIETGEVLADLVRASNERDFFVTGDAVNTAARLETAAEPGDIVVGSGTYRASRDSVDYEALPALDLKGKARPVAAWRAVALKTTAGRRRTQLALESPLLGREDEMARLEEAVHRAIDAGRPHVVTILGSAGVGKSRLVLELERQVGGLSDTIHWRKGRCVAYGDRSYGPIADVFKADTGIADDDDQDTARRKLDRRLTGLGLASEGRVRDALEAVLGIDEWAGRQRGELFDAWRHYLATIADHAPLVLVIEDIHWADDDVLAFLEFLARRGEGSMAIVCLARDELLEQNADWGATVPESTLIVLEPLDEAASAALVDNLLDGGLPADLKVLVVDRSEGNPLFAEETVRMLVDRGVLCHGDVGWQLDRAIAEVEIPDSIHAVLAARLDTLPTTEKRLVQIAAVVGRIFWDRLVEHLAGTDRGHIEERLGRLRAKGLVVLREPSALAGATEFGFRHVLIRDVAYESLPKRDRADIHEGIATWVEQRLADRIDDFAELVASHLTTALGYEEAFARSGSAQLRSIRERTYEAAPRAARRASSLGVIDRACRWMRTAIELAYALERSPREIARLADEDVRIHGLSMRRPDHIAMLTRAVDGLERLAGVTDEDEQLLARLRSALANAYIGRAVGRTMEGAHLGVIDLETCRALLRHGIARLEAGRPSPGRARLYHTLGFSYSHAWHHADAVPYLETALAEATACGDAETVRWALHDLGTCARIERKGPHKSIELMQRSYDLALDAGDRALVLRCRHNLSIARFERGDPMATILELSEEALRQARLGMEGRLHPGIAWSMAIYLREMGRLDEALAIIDESIAAAGAEGQYLGTHYVFRAAIHRGRGEVTAAERDESASYAADGEPFPDDLAYHIEHRAWGEWTRDPLAAAANLEAGLDRADLDLMGKAQLTNTLARMALRLGDDAQLERAIAAYRGLGRSWMKPIHEWTNSVDGIAATDAGATLETPAARLEESEYNLAALDLWMDAALLAARAGRTTEAGDRARAIIERTGLHPLIGPYPERRWLMEK